METKVCKDCGAELPVEEFYHRISKATGERMYYAVCKKCHSAITSKNNAAKLRRTDDFKYLSYRMMLAAKKRAGEKGLPFDLTTEWIEARIAAGHCEVTGLAFDVSRDVRRERSRNPWMPSLDRKDNSKGYTMDNVQVVIWIYNQAKGEWRNDEFMTLVKALAKPLFKEAIESGRLKIAA